jgi:hypothetical protein
VLLCEKEYLCQKWDRFESGMCRILATFYWKKCIKNIIAEKERKKEKYIDRKIKMWVCH